MERPSTEYRTGAATDQLIKRRRLCAASQDRFIGWPGWPTFKATAGLSVIFAAIFYSLYALTDFLTGLHDYRIRIHFGWESDVPFIPALSIIYVSLSPLLFLAPFVIRDADDFRVFFKIMVIETIIAAICFLLLPVQSGYPDKQVSGFFLPVYNVADYLNLTYNELPSLHVAFAYTAAIVFGHRWHKTGRMLLLSWASLIAVSTLFTHQHHLLSVVAGMLLALTTYQLAKLSHRRRNSAS